MVLRRQITDRSWPLAGYGAAQRNDRNRLPIQPANMAVALPPGTGIFSVWGPRKPADLVPATRCYGLRNAPH